jgi:C-terminal region of eIF3h
MIEGVICIWLVMTTVPSLFRLILHCAIFVTQQQENKVRADRGEGPLPEEDLNKLFKPPIPPSRLDSLLHAGQISVYASQMSEFATQTFGKLFMVDSLQEASGSGTAANISS